MSTVNSSSSQAAITNEINNLQREMKNRESVQVVKDETGTRRVILDKDGLRTSQSGIDVFEATNDQLTFNSNNNVFKIVATGTITPPNVSISTAASRYGLNTEFAEELHGLGFAPSFIAFLKIGGTYEMLPFTTGASLNSATGFAQSEVRFSVDETKIYAISEAWGFNTGGSYEFAYNGNPIKYYLLQETASA